MRYALILLACLCLMVPARATAAVPEPVAGVICDSLEVALSTANLMPAEANFLEVNIILSAYPERTRGCRPIAQVFMIEHVSFIGTFKTARATMINMAAFTTQGGATYYTWQASQIPYA